MSLNFSFSIEYRFVRIHEFAFLLSRASVSFLVNSSNLPTLFPWLEFGFSKMIPVLTFTELFAYVHLYRMKITCYVLVLCYLHFQLYNLAY